MQEISTSSVAAPSDEERRLAALRQCSVLDTPPQAEFDDITRLAAHICGVPIAAVSLIDADRQWFKSIVGLPVTETPRSAAFCAHTILQDSVMVVPDAQADARFAGNPLVTGDPNIRFYAGAPLITEDGHALGSLCVIDRAPRQLALDQQEALRLLARLVTNQLEKGRRDAEREQAEAERLKIEAERLKIEAERLRLAAIIETSEDAIYSMTFDGCILSWNRGAERLYGYSAAEMSVRPAGVLIPPGRHDELRHLLAAAARGEALAPLETVRLTKAGPSLDVSLSVSSVVDAQGCVIGVSLIARDITERKRIEAALQHEREFTQALLESLQEGIVACDADGTLALFNRAARELHGLPAEPLPAAQWAEHFDLYAADGITPMATQEIPLLRAFEGEMVRDVEMVVAPRFEAPRILLASGQPIRDGAGRKLGAVVAMHDITDRRQAERELARLAAIVESSEEAILAATLDGTLVSWNGGAERLYGYAAAEMVGRNTSVLADEDEPGPVPAVVARLLRGETVEPMEVARTRRDGSKFHAALSFSPLRDAAGQIVGLSCIARDITARKQAEDALAESEARLRRLTDAAFEGIVISQNGALLDASPAFAAMFGYDSPAQMTGLPVTLLPAPASLALVMQKVADGDEEPYEATLQRRDGTLFPAEIRARQIQLGGRTAHVTAIRDISDQRAMEEALRESHRAMQESAARLAEAQRVAKIGSWEFDLAANKITWSDELFRLFGLDPALGEPDYTGAVALYHPEDAPLLDALVKRAAQEGIGYEIDLRGAPDPRSGLPPWYHTVGTVQRDADGQVIRLAGILADITERKRAEEALRQGNEALAKSSIALEQSRRFAHSIAEHSASIIFVFDLDTKSNVYANRDVGEFLGYPPEQVAALGADLLPMMIHPEDMPRLMAHFGEFEHALDGQVLEFEYRARHADGGWRWVWNREVVFERHADGRPLRILGNAQDVTAQKTLETNLRQQAEQLRRSEAALRAVLESAPVILYAADADGRVTLSEGAGLTALGLKPGEAVGRSVFEFSAGNAEIEAFTRRALAGEALSYDAQVYGLSLHTELRPLRDADSAPAGFIGVCFDVTERVASEERFRVLFEESSDAHLLLGDKGTIDCNAATVALLGCNDKSQVLSLHPAVMSPEFQPDGRLSREKKAEMDALAHERGFHRFEWMLKKMDGKEFPVEVSLTPVTLAGASVLLVVLHDLTERKQAEEMIKDHAVVLEFQKHELEQANAELASLATTDGMTGLKNHRAFQEQLAEEVSRASRCRSPLSLILVDVDRFKGFNDVFGHPAGDMVLKTVAAILQGDARTADFVARYGGEEFILLLPQTDAAGAALFAERLRAAVAAAHWPLRPVTASFGVASLRLGLEDGGSLIARADEALYLSKAGGRNRVTVSSASADPVGAG